MYKPYSKNRFLYHFTSAENSIKYILPRLQLRFSPYSETNDPYETKSWSITVKDSLEEIERSTNKEKMVREVVLFNSFRDEHIRSIKNKFKSLCFTVDSDNAENREFQANPGLKRGWGFPRMWDQYGERHQGICFMFDREILTSSIEKIAQKNYHIFAGKVEYTDELVDKKVNTIDLKDIIHFGIENSIQNNIEQNVKSYFFKKSLDWQDEREFRFILLNNAESEMTKYTYVEIQDSLKVIILGEDLDPKDESKILNLIENLNVRVYSVDWEYSNPMIYEGKYQSRNESILNPFI